MAAITYEGPDGIHEEEHPQENIDFDSETGHWSINLGENENGNTVSKSIPRSRVYSVITENEGVATGTVNISD